MAFVKSYIIGIVSIIPFNFIFLRYLAVFRVIRLIKVLQLFQIFKIINFKNYSFGALKFFIQNRLLKTLVVIIILLYNIETLAGVGYENITPVTYPGKIRVCL